MSSDSAAPAPHHHHHEVDKEFFVAIAGLIGAGKSHLAKELGQELGLPVHYESTTDNPWLVDFYTDMSKYAFPLQIDLLNRRFSQQLQLVWNGKGGIMDRSIYEDSVFCRLLVKSGFMEQRLFDLYSSLAFNMHKFMKRPSMIVYLDVSPQVSLERIRARGRPEEQGITLEYLTNLYECYQQFIIDISKTIPVVKVPWNTFGETRETARKIVETHRAMMHVHPI